MTNIDTYIIDENQTLRVALKKFGEMEGALTLFITDKNSNLVGSLTDGDARRGLIAGKGIDEPVLNFMNRNFMSVLVGNISINDLFNARKKKIQILPIIDANGRILKLIDFSFYYSYLPMDTIIMAGGEGIRLRPLTENLPKPMLQIGTKPILEHVIDRLVRFGVNNFQISVNYLGEKIESYFKDGSSKNVSISYIYENQKMGTIGALTLAKEILNNYLLVINSDILTNIDYEDFFLDFIQKDADMSIASIPYSVNIPYAIMDTRDSKITALKEKPKMNFITNAGIYLLKKEHLKRIPQGRFYNATDLIEEMIEANMNVTYYTFHDYWLDIGKMDDYNRAQQDIRQIKL